jgi:hypothetical protein
MNRAIPRWLAPVALILWLFFVLGSFFVVQKPFTAATAAAVGHVLLDGLTALWLGLIALGLGLRLLRLLPGLDFTPGESVVFGAGLGLGALGLLALAVGLAGGFTPPLAFGVTILLTLLAARPVWQCRTRAFAGERPSIPTVICLTLFGLLALLPALLPRSIGTGCFTISPAPNFTSRPVRLSPIPVHPTSTFPRSWRCSLLGPCFCAAILPPSCCTLALACCWPG